MKNMNKLILLSILLMFLVPLVSAAPKIDNLTNGTTSDSSAVVQWTVEPLANFTILLYNNSARESTQLVATISNNTNATAFFVNFTGLLNATAYFVNLTVRNATDFQLNDTNSSDFTFTTAADRDIDPPVINNLTNVSTTNITTRISFDCNENCNYTLVLHNSSTRTSEFLVGTDNNNTYATSRETISFDLTPGTTYFVNLTVQDEKENSAFNSTLSFLATGNFIGPSQAQTAAEEVMKSIATGMTFLGIFAIALIGLFTVGFAKGKLNLNQLMIAIGTLIVVAIVATIAIFIMAGLKTAI